ncbi:hypothetical protein [Luteimonas vadosa]|uniref:Uncharacterized protein n=1 Tax=Luteimonas vadosa TaxID=1165507 RepID=A0ABP9E523_9GAMM
MTNVDLTQEQHAVARLLELSQSGDVENSEFTQLGRQIYESMFETYLGRPKAADGGSRD